MKYERYDEIETGGYVFKFIITKDDLQSAKFDQFDQRLIDLCKKENTISAKLMALQILAKAVEWSEEHG